MNELEAVPAAVGIVAAQDEWLLAAQEANGRLAEVLPRRAVNLMRLRDKVQPEPGEVLKPMRCDMCGMTDPKKFGFRGTKRCMKCWSKHRRALEAARKCATQSAP